MVSLCIIIFLHLCVKQSLQVQKEELMVTWMESLMILVLCTGVAALGLRFLKHDCSAGSTERLLVITMGIGFVIGLISAILRGMTWQVMLYGAGVMLSYGATVVSFPPRKKDRA